MLVSANADGVSMQVFKTCLRVSIGVWPDWRLF